MATKSDILIAKALSTDSEEEAIACLRMARKQGLTATPAASNTNNHSTEWEAAARRFHKIACQYRDDLKIANNKLNIATQMIANNATNNRTVELVRKLKIANTTAMAWKAAFYCSGVVIALILFVKI